MANRQVYVALVLVQVMFATLPIAIKLVLREMSSPALSLVRVAGAALVFVILQKVLVGERIASLRDYGCYALLGVTLNQLLYITALTMTTATAAQTLMSAGPATTLLIAILLGRERPSRKKWIGILLAGCGALLLVGIGLGSGRALGNFLVVLNMAFFALYLVISRDLLHRYHPLTVITWVFVLGAATLVPFGVGLAAVQVPELSAMGLAMLAYIIVFPTVVAYYLNMWALTRVEPSTVSIFIYIQPVLTVLLAMPILGERPSVQMIPAVILIFAGVLVAIRAAKPTYVQPVES